MKFSVSKCQAHMGAPTPSTIGGSLTRYLGNLYRTLGARGAPFKSAAELRRSFTECFALVQNFLRHIGQRIHRGILQTRRCRGLLPGPVNTRPEAIVPEVLVPLLPGIPIALGFPGVVPELLKLALLAGSAGSSPCPALPAAAWWCCPQPLHRPFAAAAPPPVSVAPPRWNRRWHLRRHPRRRQSSPPEQPPLPQRLRRTAGPPPSDLLFWPRRHRGVRR
ncbi:hypothetical protein AHiyo4_27720 [Arthrobacter sp. Hiyo4]|nr:hypothetical protein AHiyo4_27720 [Arthrobacter sp. Hiyo4]